MSKQPKLVYWFPLANTLPNVAGWLQSASTVKKIPQKILIKSSGRLSFCDKLPEKGRRCFSSSTFITSAGEAGILGSVSHGNSGEIILLKSVCNRTELIIFLCCSARFGSDIFIYCYSPSYHLCQYFAIHFPLLSSASVLFPGLIEVPLGSEQVSSRSPCTSQMAA